MYVAICSESWGTRGYGTENGLLAHWKPDVVAKNDGNAVQPLLKSGSTCPGCSVDEVVPLPPFNRCSDVQTTSVTGHIIYLNYMYFLCLKQLEVEF